MEVQYSTAVGDKNTITGNRSIAVGADNTAATTSVAMGASNEAVDRATAIGNENKVRGINSVGIGQGNQTIASDHATAVGADNRVWSKDSTAVGRDNKVGVEGQADNVGENSSAFGRSNVVTGSQSVAVGARNEALGGNSIAMGNASVAKRASDMAIGDGAKTDAIDGATVDQKNNIALGTAAQAIGGSTIALGAGAVATGSNSEGNNNSIAIGADASARDYDSTVLGVSASTGVGASNATAVGAGATVADDAYDAVAVGVAAKANDIGAVAIGSDAIANNAGDVALGDGATTAVAVGTDSATVEGITYGGFAGVDPNSTVSVGSAENERTITNVAAGRISDSSTDAINGSQLYATNAVIGNVANSLAGQPGSILGGNATVNPTTGALTMSNIGGTGEDNIDDAIGYAAQGWNVTTNGDDATSSNVAPGDTVDFSSSDNNIEISNDGNDIDLALADDLTIGNSITVGDTVIDGDSVTTGNTVMDSSGVTVDDGTNSTTVGAGGVVIVDGPSITADGIDAGSKTITNVAPGENGTDAVNLNQLNSVSEVANQGWNVTTNGDDATSSNVAPGDTVDFSSSDNNIEISNDGNDIDLALADDLTIGNSITVGDTVIDGDSVTTGNTVMDNSGVTVDDGTNRTTVGAGGVVIVDGPSITADGIDAGSKTITNVAPGENGTDAVNLDQLNDAVAGAGGSWTVTDGTNESTIGPDGKVTFSGDDNITVTESGEDDAGQITVALKQDIDLGEEGSVTMGDTVIDNTGLTIAGGPSITTGGINAGNMVISNVAPGVQDSDAVNYGQVRPITDFVNLDDNGKFAYNGGTFNTLQEALDSMYWDVEAPASGGSSGSGSGGSGSGTGGSGSGSGSTGSGSSGSSSGSPTSIHNGHTVGFVEGDNIVISKADRVDSDGKTTGANVTIGLAQDVKVNSITAVKVQADQIQVGSKGPVISETGINMQGNTITNVGPGVNETDAVNVGQLNQATGNLQNQVNSLKGDVRELDHRLSAGVAAAMATAALPQAYLPGKNMMAIAGGTWNGESGVAIGYSGVSDNGKWVFKLTGNSSSRGDYGGAAGVGYQW